MLWLRHYRLMAVQKHLQDVAHYSERDTHHHSEDFLPFPPLIKQEDVWYEDAGEECWPRCSALCWHHFSPPAFFCYGHQLLKALFFWLAPTTDHRINKHYVYSAIKQIFELHTTVNIISKRDKEMHYAVMSAYIWSSVVWKWKGTPPPGPAFSLAPAPREDFSLRMNLRRVCSTGLLTFNGVIKKSAAIHALIQPFTMKSKYKKVHL